MPLTWIEVADTAVKIGLGALITGVGAYALAGRSHGHTLARELTAKRIAILEEACSDAEEYFSYCTNLYNTVGGIAIKNDLDGRAQTEEEAQVIAHVHAGLSQALDARNRARAKLSLLGATDAVNEISNFNRTLSRYRKTVALEEKMYSNDSHGEMTKEFRKHKQAFYASAAEFLRNAGSGRE